VLSKERYWGPKVKWGSRSKWECLPTDTVCLGFKAVGPWIWVTDCLGQRRQRNGIGGVLSPESESYAHIEFKL